MEQPSIVKPRNILVVDDEALVRMVVADMLQQQGFGVVEASSADEALDILEGREDIGAVVSDVRMPGSLDGIGLATIVASRWPHIATLLVSAYTGPMVGALPAGVGFLPKPVHESALVRQVGMMLEPDPPPREGATNDIGGPKR
jgi:DNA-binding NtrC family response regulator